MDTQTFGTLMNVLTDNQLIIEKYFLAGIDYIGAFAFAISGIRLASTKQFDFLGAFIIGLVTAIGGGTLRDMILGVPVQWLTSPSYFIATFVALVSAYLFRKIIVKMEYTLFIFDTIGLGLFTVVGITITLDHGYSMFIATLLGAITGCAGGVIRDVLLGEVPMLFRKDLYIISCITGGVVYYLCTLVEIEQIGVQLLTMTAVIGARLLSKKHNASLPIIKSFDFHE